MPYSSYSGESESTARHKDYESINDSDSRKARNRDDDRNRDPDRSNSSDYRRRRGNETGNRQRRAQKSRRTDYSDEYSAFKQCIKEVKVVK